MLIPVKRWDYIQIRDLIQNAIQSTTGKENIKNYRRGFQGGGGGNAV